MVSLPIEQPQGFSPYPIESILAQGMMDPAKSGVAAALMAGYQGMRQGNQAQYSQDVAVNRALVAQQMQAQARAKAIESVLAAMKQSSDTPGMFQALQSNPLFAGMFEGNPQAYQAMIGAIARNNIAQNMQRAGSGANNLVDAGFVPSASTMSEVIGVPLSQSTPLSLQRAAAGGGGNGSGSKDEVTITDGTFSTKIRRNPNEPETQFAARAEAMRQAIARARKARSNEALAGVGVRINGDMRPRDQVSATEE